MLEPDSPDLHREETRVAARLPRDLPVPHLLGHVEVAGWVVLVFDDVAGRHPHLPWESADLAVVLDGLRGLAAGYFLDAARHPAPVGLPTVRAFQRVQGEALLNWLRPRLNRAVRASG